MLIIPITFEFLPTFDFCDDEFSDLILNKIKDTYKFKCTKKYGYILSVISIEKIRKKYISIYNGNVIIDCDILVDNILPKIGEIYTAEIKNIYLQGLILLLKKCIRVFVPIENKKLDFQVGSNLNFLCSQVRFRKGSWDCIGKLID